MIAVRKDRHTLYRWLLIFAVLINLGSGKEIASPDDDEPWTGRWMPDRTTTDSTVNLHDKLHGIKMGVVSSECDDGKTNLTVDWDYSPEDYTCFTSSKIVPNYRIKPILECEHIPKYYVARHECMNTSIHYDVPIPTFGTHRPLWAKYGEYKYLPKQRWLHNLEDKHKTLSGYWIIECLHFQINEQNIFLITCDVMLRLILIFRHHRARSMSNREAGKKFGFDESKVRHWIACEDKLKNATINRYSFKGPKVGKYPEHGAVVMLYHPCANPVEVNRLRKLVTGCLRRHVISPFSQLDEYRPLALVTWGCRLTMSSVEPNIVIKFIKQHALKGYEHTAREGQFDLGLQVPAKVVSDINDSVLCPF